MGKVKAPGLKWVKRAGRKIPVWVADEIDVRKGYSPKTLNLEYMADELEMLIARCNALQSDMLLWRSGFRNDPLGYDGTVKSVLSIYQRHEFSSFQNLRPTSRNTYIDYLPKLEAHIGNRRIDAITGIDIMRWHDDWSHDGKHLAAASMLRAILEAALKFGKILRLDGCAELLEIARETRRSLPRQRPRTSSVTADQIIEARKVAHAAGRPSSALAYALAFETTLRLWDVIGQWWPMDKGGLSATLSASTGEKWFGLKWEDIDEFMVLRFTPSKTQSSTGKSVIYPLAKAPMVLDELRHWPIAGRNGPVVVSEVTGLPYKPISFGNGWRADRKAAGIPTTVWARDIRASGITEGRANNASLDDAAKVAGHSGKQTTGKVYDRAVLEAADRFADIRIKARENGGNTSGNGR